MRFDIITIFPQIFDSYFSESILARAQRKRLIKIKAHDLRKWADDKHKKVDDSPYGGGPGMIFKVEPIYKAVESLLGVRPRIKYGASSLGRDKKSLAKARVPKRRVILFSAKGKQFTQADARQLVKYDQIIMICGRYEGVDERVAEHIADEKLSVGNFVLTGGEIPAMIVVDAVSRLVPGVLGKEASLKDESFGVRPLGRDKNSLAKARTPYYLEYPQYTRPEKFKGWKVPKILLSGDHGEIEKWRKEKSQIE